MFKYFLFGITALAVTQAGLATYYSTGIRGVIGLAIGLAVCGLMGVGLAKFRKR